jgi:hypothetical protein
MTQRLVQQRIEQSTAHGFTDSELRLEAVAHRH